MSQFYKPKFHNNLHSHKSKYSVDDSRTLSFFLSLNLFISSPDLCYHILSFVIDFDFIYKCLIDRTVCQLTDEELQYICYCDMKIFDKNFRKTLHKTGYGHRSWTSKHSKKFRRWCKFTLKTYCRQIIPHHSFCECNYLDFFDLAVKVAQPQNEIKRMRNIRQRQLGY